MTGRIAARRLDSRCLTCGEYLTDDEVHVDEDAIRDLTIDHIRDALYHKNHEGKRCGPVEKVVCR